ncbi:CASP-like protein 5a1 [Phtheirospermum japonicum]|uniref:CASP-like protein n=1 Tax=Phtheirospermum japonicum TaxID=374723 RepID=A0A830B992_9LAMI|nr:CASP-like protein 5a1 [Phtheirospermum japonicum]
MNMSQAAVHPVEAPPLQTEGAGNVPLPRVRMKDFQGMPGTAGGLALRVAQLLFAVVALTVMATTSDFPSVTAFCYLVAAAGFQSLWSLVLAILDAYALLVGRRLQNPRIVGLFAVGDGQELSFGAFDLTFGPDSSAEQMESWCFNGMLSESTVTSTLTFAAACASAGITVLIGNDLGACDKNHCTEFETATAMAFLSWFTALPSFLLNFWSLASR